MYDKLIYNLYIDFCCPCLFHSWDFLILGIDQEVENDSGSDDEYEQVEQESGDEGSEMEEGGEEGSDVEQGSEEEGEEEVSLK